MSADDRARRPLDGIRIVSLAEQYPGPFATLVLSDLGADVVQVERPTGGDPARAFPSFHAALNRGKRSVALDLKHAPAREALRQLVARADAVLEGFRPGVLARLGLGPDALREVNPELVFVSISGFGQTGPYRDRPAHDLSYQAMTGHLADHDGVDGHDAPGLSLADLVSGLFGAIATLTGVVAVRSGHPASTFDVSMFDSMISLLTTQLGPSLNETPPDPVLGGDPGYGLFATADGRWISLSIAFEDKFWDALCRAVDLPQHLGIPAAERSARRNELRGDLATVFARDNLRSWEARLTGTEVPHGAVAHVDELERDPHVRARELVQEVGDRRFVRQPVVVDGQAHGPTSGTSAIGEDTARVLRAAGVDEALVVELTSN